MKTKMFHSKKLDDTTLRAYRWYWPWQDEEEEAWLGAMAQQGWMLMKPDWFGQYTFRACEPQDVVYRFDYYTGANPKEKATYLQIFYDTGWEYVAEMGGWQYFRKPVINGVASEIFNDTEGKIQKYKRLMAFLTIMLGLLLLTAPNLGPDTLTGIWIIRLAYLSLGGLYVYVLWQLKRRIAALKQI